MSPSVFTSTPLAPNFLPPGWQVFAAWLKSPLFLDIQLHYLLTFNFKHVLHKDHFIPCLTHGLDGTTINGDIALDCHHLSLSSVFMLPVFSFIHLSSAIPLRGLLSYSPSNLHSMPTLYRGPLSVPDGFLDPGPILVGLNISWDWTILDTMGCVILSGWMWLLPSVPSRDFCYNCGPFKCLGLVSPSPSTQYQTHFGSNGVCDSPH